MRAERQGATSAGIQSQIVWSQFPRVVVDGDLLDVLVFHMMLSHSYLDPVVRLL